MNGSCTIHSEIKENRNGNKRKEIKRNQKKSKEIKRNQKKIFLTRVTCAEKEEIALGRTFDLNWAWSDLQEILTPSPVRSIFGVLTRQYRPMVDFQKMRRVLSPKWDLTWHFWPSEKERNYWTMKVTKTRRLYWKLHERKAWDFNSLYLPTNWNLRRVLGPKWDII